MKILFFSMHMMQGGAERVISTLCNGTFGKQNKLYILTVLTSKAEFRLPDQVKHYGLISSNEYFCKGKMKTLPMVCRKYYSFVNKLRPDIILAFLPEPCFIAGVYRKALGIPIIGSERGNPYYQFRKPMYRILGNLLYARADGFVFQTEGARNFFISKIRRNSVIIGNPILHEDLPVVSMNERRKEIVAVGRFTVEKNYILLIKAFARVRDMHPDFKLRIYGKYDADDKAVKLIKTLGLTDSIILEGAADDVKQKINRAYAFVLTSFTEGLPNALMEAMSVGLPVVATDCPSGGPRQLVKDGVNGLLVPNESEDGVAHALNRLIEDAEFAGRLGTEARKIELEYSEEKISNMWIQYISKISSNIRTEDKRSVCGTV